jgi:hypothetical protein
MGKRSISLVAGGMARAVIGPVISNTSEIGQLYVPEPGRTAQILAGARDLRANGPRGAVIGRGAADLSAVPRI